MKKNDTQIHPDEVNEDEDEDYNGAEESFAKLLQLATLKKANVLNSKDKHQTMNPNNHVNEDSKVLPENPSTCFSVLEDPNYHPNTGVYF